MTVERFTNDQLKQVKPLTFDCKHCYYHMGNCCIKGKYIRYMVKVNGLKQRHCSLSRLTVGRWNISKLIGLTAVGRKPKPVRNPALLGLTLTHSEEWD